MSGDEIFSSGLENSLGMQHLMAHLTDIDDKRYTAGLS